MYIVHEIPPGIGLFVGDTKYLVMYQTVGDLICHIGKIKYSCTLLYTGI